MTPTTPRVPAAGMHEMIGAGPPRHCLSFGCNAVGSGVVRRRELIWHGPALMGVVNVTPDSFSDGGDSYDHQRAVTIGLQHAAEGAMIVDVGGESTRPGAAPVSAAEELRRVLPVVQALSEAGVVVSIDTRKAEVAKAALASGAALVNDVGGLRDERMIEVCAAAGAPAVVMHMQGEPATMQTAPHYDDVVAEVSAYLSSTAAAALAQGLPDLLIDPGIGFGKSLQHNLTLLRRLPELTNLGHGVLVGASRKALIGALSGETDPKNRLPGTVTLHLHAAQAGAALLRVHDVAAHQQALSVWRALQGWPETVAVSHDA